MRLIGAGLVLAAGAIHLYLYFDYFHRVATIGPLFLLNAGVVEGLAIVVFLVLIAARARRRAPAAPHLRAV